jgi:hypothetical protein
MLLSLLMAVWQDKVVLHVGWFHVLHRPQGQ